MILIESGMRIVAMIVFHLFCFMKMESVRNCLFFSPSLELCF